MTSPLEGAVGDLARCTLQRRPCVLRGIVHARHAEGGAELIIDQDRHHRVCNV